MPHFSIIIPLYNKANHIARTIDSVLRQSFKDFELIVVNDGSTDGGEKVAWQYNDPRIKIINQPNGGESSARNSGINIASADYIAFLDADDTWDFDFLEIINELIIKFPTAAGYATHIRNSAILQQQVSLYFDATRGDDAWVIDNYFECLNSGYFPVTSSSVCIKKSLLIEIQGFNVNLKIGPDIDAWIKVFLAADIAISNRFAATYHTDAENRSINRLDFSIRELEFFEHLRKSYLKSTLDLKYYIALNEWSSKRIFLIVIRSIYQGNKRFAARVLRDNWKIISGRKKLIAIARLCTPNILVESIKKMRGSEK